MPTIYETIDRKSIEKMVDYIVRPPKDDSNEELEEYTKRVIEFLDFQLLNNLFLFQTHFLFEPKIEGKTSNNKQYSEIADEFYNYQYRNAGRLYDVGNDYRAYSRRRYSLPYGCLNDLMKIMDLNMESLFHLFDKSIPALPDDVRYIKDCAESLSRQQRQNLHKFVITLSPMWWRSDKVVNESPQYRIVKYRTRKFAKRDNHYVFSMRLNFNDNTVFDFAMLPDIAEKLECSVHWLLQTVDNVYSPVEYVDDIIDAMFFLRPFQRQSIVAAIQNIQGKA